MKSHIFTTARRPVSAPGPQLSVSSHWARHKERSRVNITRFKGSYVHPEWRPYEGKMTPNIGEKQTGWS